LEGISLVAEGKGNKGIAHELGIQEQTVKNHLASIMLKLGVKSRLAVGLHAVRQNLAAENKAPAKGTTVTEKPALAPNGGCGKSVHRKGKTRSSGP
jgi:predicted transcriptional regulator